MRSHRIMMVVAMVVVLMAVVGQGQFHRPQQFQSCPGVCTNEYNPVCGSDSNTYPNLCLLQDERRCNNPQLSVVTFSECGDQQCPGVCTEEFAPVCGSDGDTYDNLCLFLDERRCDNHNLTIVKHGACEGSQHQGGCPGVCTAEYNPVCGSDGKTYSNLCVLITEIRCNNPHLSFVSQGACGGSPHDCPGSCTLDYNPVCGSDGKTYGNLCQLLNEKRCNNPTLSLVKQGECGPLQSCPGVCTLEYNPVCGSDGRTYSNPCLLEEERRCRNPHLFLVSQGVCGAPPPPARPCPRFCPLHVTGPPLCDQHGRQYSSQCFFNIAFCNDPSLRVTSCDKY